MRGEPDYGPVLVAGVLGLGALAAFSLLRKKPVTTNSSSSGGATGQGAEPPGGRPPTASPPGMPPPVEPKLVSPTFGHPSPLYLWILQDGASDWYGVGWYYGHAAEYKRPTDLNSRTVWYTPEWEVKQAIDLLRDGGIAGFFDTIEPSGVEDRNFKGRIEQEESTQGVWFWVEDTQSEPAHYVAENAHYVQEFIG